MGVRLLQTFLSEMNVKAQEMHLRTLHGKKIAIDIGIYLYRFKEVGRLIENMYLMCSIFRYYHISPIFVFDGWALEIKRKTLEKRKQIREQAKKELEMMENCNYNKDKIDILKKKMVCVNKYDYNKVKELLDAYGMTYITAKREADEVCAALCLKNITWGCLTEDTDIMAYGCKRILRYFSLIRHTFVFYDMLSILNNLKISPDVFKELCVCSGNDYINSPKNIFYYYTLFQKYTKSTNFLEWLLSNKYLSIQQYYNRKDILDIYLMKTYNPFEDIPYVVIKNKNVNKKNLIYILKSVGFIFP